jgi:60 kDa SS-A/Ro ribonucleoprotein
MANKSLFNRLASLVPRADAVNEHFAPAYALSPEHALAQYAATGCLNATYYAGAGQQLDVVLDLCRDVEPEYIAKTAIWARTHGHMKDMPALLCAVLTIRDGALCERIFPQVIDNGKMLRNFVQILRSGATGRKSLGTRPRRIVRSWLDAQSGNRLFRASVGKSPSMADVIKMVHPKPRDAAREALYAYLVGRDHNAEQLPDAVKALEAFKRKETEEAPDVPFELLTALELSDQHWVSIACTASWQMTRMNLNTFARHGVFKVPVMTEIIAARLRDPELVKSARVFPYQLMVAYTMAGEGVPTEVRDALHDAMEIATRNVPAFGGKVYVFPDVSGSMHCPVTGYRQGSTTAVRCVDVAALVSACVLRQNRDATVVPFHDRVEPAKLSGRDSILTNAQILASLPSGGTNCSAPLAMLNDQKARGDLVIYVSDNESWVDANIGGRGTRTMYEWERFKERNPTARLVCIDMQPYGTVQAKERHDVLNIGGFSDHVFQVIAEFASGRLSDGHLVEMIREVELPGAAE